MTQQTIPHIYVTDSTFFFTCIRSGNLTVPVPNPLASLLQLVPFVRNVLFGPMCGNAISQVYIRIITLLLSGSVKHFVSIVKPLFYVMRKLIGILYTQRVEETIWS
jgi:hypothetical protein